MPNHMHLIIALTEEESVATSRLGVATEDDRCWKPGCLGAIFNHLDGACTRRIRFDLDPSFAWQPRFFDHIIRDECDLDNLHLYSKLNPENWRKDEHDLLEVGVHA